MQDLRHHQNKLRSYSKQGEFLKLTTDMDADLDWKSFIFGMSRGTMKFLLNASVNTLPTANNLKQWGKQTGDKCRHCNNTETTQHVLNGCKKFLEDGRYTWRHDSVLNYIWTVMKNTQREVFADLPGKGAPGG